MDLINLNVELREGKRIPREDGRVVLITPLCRFDFPHLAKPQASRSDPNRLTYSVRGLWNWNNQNADAHVNIQPVLLTAIAEIAQRQNLSPKGWLRRGDEERLERNGKFPDGYGSGIVFASLNTSAGRRDDPESSRPAPTVKDGSGEEISGTLVKPGYYGRALISVYAVTHGGGKICFGLEAVQLLARGELLGGSRENYDKAFGAISGAETFEQDPPFQIPMSGQQGGSDPAWQEDDIPF